jgi:hypothetical protein
MFEAAKKAYRRAKERLAALRQATPRGTPPMGLAAPSVARPGPQIQSLSGSAVHLREKGSGIPPNASDVNPRLEVALDRLLQKIRQGRSA